MLHQLKAMEMENKFIEDKLNKTAQTSNRLLEELQSVVSVLKDALASCAKD